MGGILGEKQCPFSPHIQHGLALDESGPAQCEAGD